MMRLRPWLVLMLTVATADGGTSAAIQVMNAWSRATAPGMSVGVAYFELVNSGRADTLLAIETPLASTVSMHATSMSNGMMQMRETGPIELPAGGHLVFAPGGRHAMLSGLTEPLRVGETVPLTLVFRHAGRVPAQATVRSSDNPPPEAAAPATTQPFRLVPWPAGAPSPRFQLIDQENRLRKLQDYHGKIVAVFFGFVHCPDACSAELFKLSLAVKHMAGAGKLVQVLFVTLDPARDTPAVLKGYVSSFDPHFVGLTGSADQVARAAENFHVQYAQVRSGDGYTIDHSTQTYIFDKRGHLSLIGGASSSADDFAHDLTLLASRQ